MKKFYNDSQLLATKFFIVIFVALLTSCDVKEKVTLKPYSNMLVGTSWAKLLGYDIKTGKDYYEVVIFASETKAYLVRADINKKYTGPIVTCSFKRTGDVIKITGDNVNMSGVVRDGIMLLDNNEYTLISM